MHIRFGRHLDGLNPQPPETSSGVVTLGPAGLLSVLETQLGLPPQSTHPSMAAFSFMQCLRDVSSSDRFFHRSLQVDPVNVARTLLDWREQWYEAGWDGTFPDGAPIRLRDMAAVEEFTRERVQPGRGERLRRVAVALQNRGTQIERVELHTPLEELSRAWRQVLAALPCEMASGLIAEPSGPPGSDLARVQERLLAIAGDNEGMVAEQELLNGDGTLIIIKAASRDLSADAVAEFLLSTGESDRTLLVAERDGVILDNAFERAGLPRCGFRYHTRFRAATQVLKLCLALVWAPVNPHHSLQFLLHPIGLLPQWVRSRLADAVAKSPGIGGPVWSDALDRIAYLQREKYEAADAEIERLRADIDYWFGGERYEPSAGAPLDVLIGRTQRVSIWASAQTNSSKDAAESALFGAAQAQAEALLAGLAQLRDAGFESLPRLELERLVDEVTADAPDPATFAEAGHARATTAPAAVTGRWPTVIWWNLASPPAAVPYPWSRRELVALRDAGVQLPEVDDLLRQQSRDWLRLLLHATERLVLVVHDDERGTHPIWTQIEHFFGGVERVEIERALLSGETNLSPLTVATRSLPLGPLPAPRRWWALPTDCSIARRDVESYSSLSKLCDFPHEWVLQYAARLRAGRVADVSDGPLLYGNLGHRLIEEFFRTRDDWQSIPDDNVVDWVRATFPGLVEREGAVLLEPGRGVDRQRIGTTLERALVRLLSHIRAAGIEQVAPEASGEVPFAGRHLVGVIDLLLTDRNGRRAVVDVKWGRQSYRRDLLADNRALQLVIYAYLQKTLDEGELWPPGAFFILATGNLLANEDAIFPDAIVSPSGSGEGAADLWRRLGVTYDWRWEQLEAGRIEVVTDLTAPDDDAVTPVTGLTPNDGGDPFDDFVRLVGWEEFQ